MKRACIQVKTSRDEQNASSIHPLKSNFVRMKHQLSYSGIIFLLLLLFCSNKIYCQQISTNRNGVGLEHNLLFNATSRFTVTQTGNAQVDLNALFDGSFSPSYSNEAVSIANPTVITIEGLPGYHTQAAAWIGWSTRYWPANKFKIEGFDTYYTNNWITIADYSSTPYSGADFTASVPGGAYTKLRFTFYEGTGDGGRFGISELFFIHMEATTPYAGLLSSSGSNNFNGDQIIKGVLGIYGTGLDGSTYQKTIIYSDINHGLYFDAPLKPDGNGLPINFSWRGSSPKITFLPAGNVLIGKSAQANSVYKLDVAGKIRADEIVVNTTGADFVFDPTYKLPTLSELESFVKEHKHLPDIAPAKEMQENGVNMSEMQTKLLQKVEELTLYILEQDKKIANLEKQLDEIKNK